MLRGIWQRVVVATVLAGAIASVLSAQRPAFAQGSGAASPAPDTVLFNGKIITVDDRFSIAQAVAIRAERISAVGTNEAITKLAGPSTRRISVIASRAVCPIASNRSLPSGGMPGVVSRAVSAWIAIVET